jgi:CheY-like chemotaxis protein
MATILVVDDHATNRELLKTILGYQGHRVLEAGDARDALKIAQTTRPDLIISDILMPTMDGFEFVRQLRDDITIGTTPVVFSSAHYLSHETENLARACGVLHVLPKPSSGIPSF